MDYTKTEKVSFYYGRGFIDNLKKGSVDDTVNDTVSDHANNHVRDLINDPVNDGISDGIKLPIYTYRYFGDIGSF